MRVASVYRPHQDQEQSAESEVESGMQQVARHSQQQSLGYVPRGPLWPEDLLLLQEVPRRASGWSRVKVEDRLVVFHRGWRGVGIAFNETAWALQKRVAAGHGCWFQLKNLSSSVQLWCGTFHFPPGIPLVEFEAALTVFLDRKPRTTLPIIVQGDVRLQGVIWLSALMGGLCSSGIESQRQACRSQLR